MDLVIWIKKVVMIMTGLPWRAFSRRRATNEVWISKCDLDQCCMTCITGLQNTIYSVAPFSFAFNFKTALQSTAERTVTVGSLAACCPKTVASVVLYKHSIIRHHSTSSISLYSLSAPQVLNIQSILTPVTWMKTLSHRPLCIDGQKSFMKQLTV
jgi:hypothetical protein